MDADEEGDLQSDNGPGVGGARRDVPRVLADLCVLVEHLDRGAIALRIRLLRAPDGRVPDLIPPGSFQTYALNVDDGTWKTASGRIPARSEIKRISVLYDPSECQLKNGRREKQIFDSVLKSKPIAISQ